MSKAKETALGLEELEVSNPLFEQMKLTDYTKHNTIYFDTEFDRDSCLLFCRQLKKLCQQELRKEEKDRKHVKVIITSYGGSVYDYFSCASLMEYYKEKGIIIETYCYGYCMSAGAKLLILGSKGYRYATRYASILLHQIQTTNFGKQTLQERIQDSQQLQKDWKLLKSIIKNNTNLTEEEIEDFTRLNLDVFYTSEEALEKGIIDNII